MNDAIEKTEMMSVLIGEKEYLVPVDVAKEIDNLRYNYRKHTAEVKARDIEIEELKAWKQNGIDLLNAMTKMQALRKK